MKNYDHALIYYFLQKGPYFFQKEEFKERMKLYALPIKRGDDTPVRDPFVVSIIYKLGLISRPQNQSYLHLIFYLVNKCM